MDTNGREAFDADEVFTVELNRAQMGLITGVLLEAAVDGGYVYEVVATGQQATAAECLKVFVEEILDPVTDEDDDDAEEETATENVVENSRRPARKDA